jgi:hypothetical protein
LSNCPLLVEFIKDHSHNRSLTICTRCATCMWAFRENTLTVAQALRRSTGCYWTDSVTVANVFILKI